MTPSIALIGAVFALVVLTALVAGRLLYVRTMEMRKKRIHPQAAATSVQMATKLQDVQAADNYRNLFESPVFFYALASIALAIQHLPSWLVAGAWVYVALRVVHSLIHCTYNRVMHRFPIFVSSFLLLFGLWIVFFIDLVNKG